eukprot:TRINITY_DN7197_c0_g1_i1.p1 TRINITY_DN7197_c0_g1~~TRINITY_DN7197_c0_g1_i1.p1  ORF type:complete len:594 (+),score=85.17 TRINITY_DN7197_c0_g1_i1:48-1829(+)
MGFSMTSFFKTFGLLVFIVVAFASEDPDLGFGSLLSGPGAGEIIRQDVTEQVIGKIPTWLDGILIHNGGGRFEWPESGRKLTNAGDGYGKLEVFTFKNGSLEYTSKFTRSKWWNDSVAEKDIAASLAFSPPDPLRMSDKLGLPNCLAPNDNLAVNVVAVGGEVQLLSDLPGSISFNPQTLEFGKAGYPVMEWFQDEPKLPPGMQGAFGSAHPLWSESSLDGSGDIYGLINVQRVTTLDERPEELRLFKITAEEQQSPNPWRTRKAIAILKQPKGEFAPYMHSFILAGQKKGPVTHAVLVQHSMHVAMGKVIAGLGLKPITAAFDIDSSRCMRFHVVSLENGEIETIKVPMSSFGFKFNSTLVSHTVNGYFDNDGKLVVDAIGYDFLFFNRFNIDLWLNKSARDNGPYAGKKARTFRFTIDVASKRAVSVIDLLPNSDWEFPTINEAFKGKRYCFAYGYEFSHSPSLEAREGKEATGFASMAVVKYNMCGSIVNSQGKPMRERTSFTRPFNYFMEPWFVPRPGGSDEDDGVILSLALDGKVGKGVIYVLNAKDLSLIATAPLPQLVNLKTHGHFIWSHALKQKAALLDWDTIVV